MRILDRYLLREYLKALAFALLAFVALFLVVDFTEKLKNFLDHGAALWPVAQYFLWKTPYVIVMMLPVALLMATFLTLGQMARFNEISAIVTSGVSLVRLSIPALAIAALAAVSSFLLSEFVVPEATARREHILRHDIEQIPPSPETQRNDVTLRGRDGRVWVVRLYLVPERRMHDVSVYRYDGGRLIRRLDARVATWEGEHWLLRSGTLRTFDEEGVEASTPFDTLHLAAPEGPEEFADLPDDPDQLGYFDLRRYLERVSEQGRELEPYRIDLHLKLAFPLANFVVGVIGAALAMQLSHPTPALSFGLSVTIAFVYFGVMRLCETLGDGGLIPAWAAGWTPALLFGAWALWLLWRLHRR